jgi:uncharacterized membrane protein
MYKQKPPLLQRHVFGKNLPHDWNLAAVELWVTATLYAVFDVLKAVIAVLFAVVAVVFAVVAVSYATFAVYATLFTSVLVA